MNITQESDYAIRAVLIISKVGENDRIEAKKISDEGSIPLRFLLKLLRKLTQSGLIVSYRGINGGYALGKSADEIYLKDIIEAIEGSININKCLENVQNCNANRKGVCSVYKELSRVQKILIEELSRKSIAELRDMPLNNKN